MAPALNNNRSALINTVRLAQRFQKLLARLIAVLVSMMLISAIFNQQPHQAFAQPQPIPEAKYYITVIIEKIAAYQSMDNEGRPDLYAKVQIDNQAKDKSGVIDNQRVITPYWHFGRTVTTVGDSTTFIQIEVWDEDGGFNGPDDQADIGSQGQRQMLLEFDPRTCAIISEDRYFGTTGETRPALPQPTTEPGTPCSTNHEKVGAGNKDVAYIRLHIEVRPEPLRLGGVDIARYCWEKWGASYTESQPGVIPTAFTWRCTLPSQSGTTYLEISVDEACQLQYRDAPPSFPSTRQRDYAVALKANDPYSWRCYRQYTPMSLPR